MFCRIQFFTRNTVVFNRPTWFKVFLSNLQTCDMNLGRPTMKFNVLNLSWFISIRTSIFMIFLSLYVTMFSFTIFHPFRPRILSFVCVFASHFLEHFICLQNVISFRRQSILSIVLFFLLQIFLTFFPKYGRGNRFRSMGWK